jgi:hypothetical protein
MTNQAKAPSAEAVARRLEELRALYALAQSLHCARLVAPPAEANESPDEHRVRAPDAPHRAPDDGAVSPPGDKPIARSRRPTVTTTLKFEKRVAA